MKQFLPKLKEVNKYLNFLKNCFTKPQFKGSYPDFKDIQVRERSYVLSFPETLKRYEILKSRLEKIIQ